MFEEISTFIRDLFQTKDFIPLHEPSFSGKEKEFLIECIDSTFVSSVGKFVDRFESEIEEFTGAKNAIAVVNGTQALFVSLLLSGASSNTEVITQSLTFIATANAIHYTGAQPIFVDVDETMGLSPVALRLFLETKTFQKNQLCWSSESGKQIVACVPMHTLGHPCKIREIQQICEEFHLTLVEDSAESLGSYADDQHTGLFGKLGILSFNGNKIITTGGGGMILTDDDALAKRARHLTTTAKVPHSWEFNHDEVGYNFRMPNLNAALGVAQLEQLPFLLDKKRSLAAKYQGFFENIGIDFVLEPSHAKSNYWLNAIRFKNRQERDQFLEATNRQGIMTRCLWTPMHLIPMYQHCQRDDLINTEYQYDRIVNIPSSPIN